jgi:hypothetical protein
MPGGTSESARRGRLRTQVFDVQEVGQEGEGLSKGYGRETYVWLVVWTNVGA